MYHNRKEQQNALSFISSSWVEDISFLTEECPINQTNFQRKTEN